MGTPLQKVKDKSTGMVGYSVRFDKVSPVGMRVKFVTEGTLLQEMLQDPYLKQYSAIIVDEIHERSIDVDLIVGFLKNILYSDKRGRGGVPLKVIIMSATLDLGKIKSFFANSRLYKTTELALNQSKLITSCHQADSIDASDISMTFVEGKQYEVEIIYESQPTSDYMARMLQVIMQLHVKEPLPGDILAFLTGQEEIETLQAELEEYSHQLVKTLPRMNIVPLHGSLSAQAQQKGFEKLKEKFTRKIILATNIAETSITVSGVRYVVDCGLSKVKHFRPQLGLESLLIKPISKVSAIQRAGRAGRESKGKCFRLYTEADYHQLDEHELPEILRSDIAEGILKMKAMGVGDVLAFPLIDTPKILAMEKALIRLHLMGALSDSGDLSKTGKKIARLPLPASFGRVLTAVENLESETILQIIDIISCLTTDSEVFLQPKSEEDRESIEDFRRDIHHRDGDIVTLLQTMQRYAAEATDRNDWCRKRLISIRAMKMAMQIRKQLRQICHSLKLLKDVPLPDPQPVNPISSDRFNAIIKLFLKAFAANTALMAPNGGYITTQGKHSIAIHPSSVLYGQQFEAIMYLDHVFTTKSYARRVSAIKASWILEALAL